MSNETPNLGRQPSSNDRGVSVSRGLTILDDVAQDLRYTSRTLRRDIGFCAVAVLILGLGIGANTAIFSVVNAVLIRSLPFRQPGQLVWIANTGTSGLSGATTRVVNFQDWRKSSSCVPASRLFSTLGRPAAANAGIKFKSSPAAPVE
jgi:hypothetical protein